MTEKRGVEEIVRDFQVGSCGHKTATLSIDEKRYRYRDKRDCSICTKEMLESYAKAEIARLTTNCNAWQDRAQEYLDNYQTALDQWHNCQLLLEAEWQKVSKLTEIMRYMVFDSIGLSDDDYNKWVKLRSELDILRMGWDKEGK